MCIDKNKDFKHLKHELPKNGILAIIPKEYNTQNILCIYDNEKSIEFKDSKLSKSDKTVLQNSLKSINLEIPTDFFALHERSFDWFKYEI